MPTLDTILPLVSDIPGGITQAKQQIGLQLQALSHEVGTVIMSLVGNGAQEAQIHGFAVSIALLDATGRRVLWIRDETLLPPGSPFARSPGPEPVVVKFFSADDRLNAKAAYDIWDAGMQLKLMQGFSRAEA